MKIYLLSVEIETDFAKFITFDLLVYAESYEQAKDKVKVKYPKVFSIENMTII